MNSLHLLTDESEKGAVAMLTASSEEKHINGSSSDKKNATRRPCHSTHPADTTALVAGIS